MVDKKNKSDTINYDRITLESTMEVFLLCNQNVSIVTLLIHQN